MKKTSVQKPQTAVVNCTTDKNEEAIEMKTMNVNEIIAQAQTDIAAKAAKIRSALVERTAYVVAAKSCPIESAEIREATRNFLGQLSDEKIVGGADVVLRKEMTGITTGFQTEKVVLAWDKNPKGNEEGKRPNVLWVHIVPQVRPVKTMADKAVSFFSKKYPDMPDSVIQELFNAGWDGDELTLCVHPSAKPIILKAQADKDKQGRYLLQEPDEKGNIIPNRPIAYAVGNRVYVSIPHTPYARPWTFRANPKRDDQE